MINMNESNKAFKEAQKYIPGGVNSPVRSFKSVGSKPLFMDKGAGAYLYDIDGNKYQDFCMSWGALILGHAYPGLVRAVKDAVDKGTSYGTPTKPETTLAKLIIDSVPSIEKVRFVNSGTEAVMSTIRLVRAYTGKDKIIKFDGCYHGHVDNLLVSAGSGVAELNSPSSAGVPGEFINKTISVPFNDKKSLENIFKQFPGEIAGVIVEPVPANMGVILPGDGFLEFLQKITKKYNTLLIFDEVITGFRLGLNGAQGYFGISADLTCLGKIIGGGFPVGAFGGKKEIMDLLAPEGEVYQAGTLSGNPVTMTAGIITLKILLKDNFYFELNQKTKKFISSLAEVFKSDNICINSIGSMFTIFFNKGPINNYQDVQKCDFKKFAEFYNFLLDEGVYLSPSQFETNFVSRVHKKEELENIISVIEKKVRREVRNF